LVSLDLSWSSSLSWRIFVDGKEIHEISKSCSRIRWDSQLWIYDLICRINYFERNTVIYSMYIKCICIRNGRSILLSK
jgi:hypothetical protein